MFGNIVRTWNEMSTYRKIRRVFMIGLFFFGLWALTPYLYNRRIDEAFPAAAPVAQPQPTTMAKAEAPAAAPVAQPQPTAMAKAEAPAAAPAAQPQPTVMAKAEAPAGPVALLKGGFVAGSTPGDRATGTATVFRIDNSQNLLRLEDFDATNGPDLFVVLSGSADPETEGVKSGGFLQLAALKGNQGNQNYELPADIDLSQYKSVVIWCRTFNIVFGFATLQPAA